MLKQLLFCFAFAAVGTVPAIAEQQAVVLRKVELPGAGFDIVFAASKGHKAVTVSRPDAKYPLIISPSGSEFAHAVQGDIEDIFKDVGVTLVPIHAFRLELQAGSSSNALNVYIVPKLGPPMQ